MAFSLVIVLLVLMATGGGRGRGRGRRGVSKRTRTSDESSDFDSDYRASSHEEAEETAEYPDKGKGKAPESSRKKKGVGSSPRQSTGGPVIREGGVCERESRSKHAAEVQTTRRKAFSSQSCIGERHVNFTELIQEVPHFGHLLQRAPIEPVGHIPARSLFCVELIREFYMHGKVFAEDEETGTYMFETYVHKKRILMTPHTIGKLLGLNVDTSGFHYTSGDYQSSSH
ncbi:uncharacterized protein LOC109718678 [Ananas comosus]|uniref:Uncharacterized protein LOC109718678 n=1 Tax=Ananas comosus TaxID=4615 RepID=A0A6P5G5S9_ANACO|nr:uncharacterized protein LOC109718678 [Ananas comosus]